MATVPFNSAPQATQSCRSRLLYFFQRLLGLSKDSLSEELVRYVLILLYQFFGSVKTDLLKDTSVSFRYRNLTLQDENGIMLSSASLAVSVVASRPLATVSQQLLMLISSYIHLSNGVAVFQRNQDIDILHSLFLSRSPFLLFVHNQSLFLSQSRDRVRSIR